MAAAEKKKSGMKGLGRGLDALLGDVTATKPVPGSPSREGAAAPGPKRELPIEQLKANADQPRRTFDKDAIEELANSISSKGMLQPILVRPQGQDSYEIVAGERRWRAAQKAQLHKVPVIIRELTDEETAEIALIENVQRVDLNPVEEAAAYARLADVFGRTQDDIAKAVGKSRSHVANIMRLLNLPKKALDALSANEITMGHARALLGSSAPKQMLDIVLKGGLSVRETEAHIRQAEAEIKGGASAGKTAGGAAKTEEKSKASSGSKDADTRALERDLSNILGLDVAIDHSKKGAGSVTINYLTLDQLDDLCRRLMGANV
ncbi:ParB/RepB/Spo0J family partition protein [Hyphococcus luteus]|uniref:Chromosome partitioning protein ParB n=1 Tax=Hyphococcus luteus TaxID=2058213 RepID=A0A2S7K6Q0_9PROT|nr:ParB/RepB/Spo0J family partition protein [Marinicaulis flavus]PQA88183.1 chromosome partitioning protein ParB [Marinicaulis flavus]